MNKLMYALLALGFLLAGCREKESEVTFHPTQRVKVVIPLQFITSEPAIDDQGNTIRSAAISSGVENDFTLFAVDHQKNIPAARAITRFNNTWVLAFASNGSCLSCENAGEVSPDVPISVSMVAGENMTLYILANGPATLPQPTLLSEFESSGYYSTDTYTNENEVPYIGKVSGVNVDEKGRLFNDTGTDVQVPLKRIAAKLSLTCTVSVPDYSIESVRLHNAPSKMYYVYSNTAALINADPVDASNISGNTYSWFIGENLRGTGSSTNQFERYADNAPASSTFIRVILRSTIGAETVAYDIYPGKDLAQNYDLARNWDYTYTTTFNKNGTQLTSDGRVAVTGIPIDLTAVPSNCYILSPGNSYKFDPRIKGEGQNVTGETDIPVRHDPDEIRLTWQDTPSLVQSIGISTDHSIVVVCLNPDLEGNAVATAYAGGHPVWSWHLWVRSKIINWYTTNKVSGMSCVLGALNKDNDDFGGTASLGLLYQWGRNVPFPRSASVDGNTPMPVYDIDNNPVSFTTSKGAESIRSVIEHPTTFYYTGVAGSSWHTDGDDLWGGTSGTKSIFDPCPRGWKIPQDVTIWNNWVSDTSSLTCFSWEASNLARLAHENKVPKGLYPAAGFYTNMPGDRPVLTHVGYAGSYWSAIFAGGQAKVLYFTARISGSSATDNDLVKQFMTDQTYGCSVRPVKY